MRKKRKVLRNADFPVPKLTDSEFDELCKTLKISSSHLSDMKRRLDELVRTFGEWMTGDRRQPDRTSDRKRLEDALLYAENAAARIDQLGPSGGRAIRTISDSIAPMLAAQWLNEKFSDDDYTPQRSRLPSTDGPRPSLRAPLRGPKYFIEEESLRARFEFVQRCPIKTTVVVLKEIKKGLETALRSLDLQPGSKGGRKPLTYRHYLVINLAEIWDTLERNVSTSATSEFTVFCEGVAESIGWPTDGMSAAIPDAVTDWLHLTRKRRR
jgi:hypothetical protein